MGNITLRAFTVLVVDKDDSHRWLLNNVLESLGVGEVITANSNDEALSLIKRLGALSIRKRVQALDMVFMDLDMPGTDGLSVLQWVRMNENSPNPFLPIILMDTHLDPVDLAEVRGFGASQFLIKPASSEAIADKIMTLVNRPRQFVYTPTFFGPDRRGGQRPFAAERRHTKDIDVKIIRGPVEAMIEQRPTDGLIRYYRPTNQLKMRAGGTKPEEDALFTLSAMDNASRAVEQSKQAYLDNTRDYLESLSAILHEAEHRADRRNHFQRINSLARQLGIQGDTFGYPLVTIIGNSLSRFTAGDAHKDDSAMDLVKAHLDSVNVILRNQIAGDGGAVGKELVSQLQAAIRKITERAQARAAS